MNNKSKEVGAVLDALDHADAINALRLVYPGLSSRQLYNRLAEHRPYLSTDDQIARAEDVLVELMNRWNQEKRTRGASTLERASRGSTLTAREREATNTPTFEERKRADIENRAIQRSEESQERETGEFHDLKREVKKAQKPVPYEDARRVPTPEQWNQSQKELKKHDGSKEQSRANQRTEQTETHIGKRGTRKRTN